MIDLTPILQAVLSLGATIITVIVIPYIKSKTTTEQQASMKSWAHTAVKAAEQLYPKSGSGKAEKAYMLNFLNQHGFTVDNTTLEALIESAVNTLNTEQFRCRGIAAARRIMSGNLLQFITKEEMFINDVACLGFYGPFLPMVQFYSCATSPFWFGKAFLCLALDKDHAFWTEKEQPAWDSGAASVNTLPSPGIRTVNHRESGITEIKTAKFILAQDSDYFPAYARVAFSSALPWEAIGDFPAEAMAFKRNGAEMPTAFAFCKEAEGVLYRTAFFDITKSRVEKIDMADIEVPYGTLRVDRPRTVERPYTLTLRHFGLPFDGSAPEIKEGTVTFGARQLPYIIAKGKEYQTAIVIFSGWKSLSYLVRGGVSAVSEKSCLLYAEYKREKYYDKSELLVALYLTKPAGAEFTAQEMTAFNGLEKVDFIGVDGLVSM